MYVACRQGLGAHIVLHILKGVSRDTVTEQEYEEMAACKTLTSFLALASVHFRDTDTHYLMAEFNQLSYRKRKNDVTPKQYFSKLSDDAQDFGEQGLVFPLQLLMNTVSNAVISDEPDLYQQFYVQNNTLARADPARFIEELVTVWQLNYEVKKSYTATRTCTTCGERGHRANECTVAGQGGVHDQGEGGRGAGRRRGHHGGQEEVRGNARAPSSRTLHPRALQRDGEQGGDQDKLIESTLLATAYEFQPARGDTPFYDGRGGDEEEYGGEEEYFDEEEYGQYDDEEDYGPSSVYDGPGHGVMYGDDDVDHNLWHAGRGH